jgi:putative aldouronate transport system substrate-binding protein
MPAVIPTQAESREYATIMQEINTFIDEQTARWLLGTDPVNDATWTAYINRINQMNIARAIAIQNAALDRYNRR